MKPASAKMTYAEYCLLPEDRNQYELFDGELVVTPSPTARHQEIVTKLANALTTFVTTEPVGKVYVAPLDVIFSDHTVVQPDILFVAQSRVDTIVKERIEGAPDLVVEVLSPSTFYKDLRKKMAVYSQFGVREYWIVDPETKTIEVHHMGRSGPELSCRLSAEEKFESQVLPGFRLNLSDLFK